MSEINVTTVSSKAANTPPVIEDSGGTEVGQFCRAGVNFNGTGTVAIRDSFNVASLTDNGTGDYTVNFTIAMPDANYSSPVSALGGIRLAAIKSKTSSALSVYGCDSAGTLQDVSELSATVFSN